MKRSYTNSSVPVGSGNQESLFAEYEQSGFMHTHRSSTVPSVRLLALLFTRLPHLGQLFGISGIASELARTDILLQSPLQSLQLVLPDLLQFRTVDER